MPLRYSCDIVLRCGDVVRLSLVHRSSAVMTGMTHGIDRILTYFECGLALVLSLSAVCGSAIGVLWLRDNGLLTE